MHQARSATRWLQGWQQPAPLQAAAAQKIHVQDARNDAGEKLPWRAPHPSKTFSLRPEKNTLIESRPTTVSRGKVRHVATRAATGNITKNKYKFHWHIPPEGAEPVRIKNGNDHLRSMAQRCQLQSLRQRRAYECRPSGPSCSASRETDERELEADQTGG